MRQVKAVREFRELGPYKLRHGARGVLVRSSAAVRDDEQKGEPIAMRPAQSVGPSCFRRSSAGESNGNSVCPRRLHTPRRPHAERDAQTLRNIVRIVSSL
jgi:hypothetical protein